LAIQLSWWEDIHMAVRRDDCQLSMPKNADSVGGWGLMPVWQSKRHRRQGGERSCGDRQQTSILAAEQDEAILRGPVLTS
jgi:hypothetical protein